MTLSGSAFSEKEHTRTRVRGEMKFIRAVVIVVCIVLVLAALLCLVSDMGGKSPLVVYALQAHG